MAKVRVGDIEMYWEEHGDAAGEPVLLIMGYACNAAAWAPQIPALVEAGYRVIAFDNRGAGRTTQPEGAYSIPQMADDAAGLLDAIGVTGAVHVIGASMGGMIAQEFAMRYPSRVRTLSLLCTTPGGPKSFGYAEMVETSKQLDEIKDLSELATPERMQQTIDVMFTPEFMKAPGAGFQAMVTSSIMYPSTLAGLRGQVKAINAHDTYDRLSQISVPTFVSAGGDDTLVDARNSPLLAERIKGARLKMFAGQRHGFTAEVAEAVNAALLEFLASAKSAPAREGGIIERIKGLFGKRGEHARSGTAGA